MDKIIKKEKKWKISKLELLWKMENNWKLNYIQR